MKPAQHPTHEQVRQWMKQRQVEHKPPPDPQTIREQLGWRMIEAEQQGAERAR